MGRTHLSIASGDIHGSFKQLNGDLTVSSAKGNTEINIKDITSNHLKLSSASGSISLGLPTTFDSTFKLSTFVGSRVIQASNPDNIHKKQGGFGSSSGYYGNADTLKGQVDLSTAKGDLVLSYTQ